MFSICRASFAQLANSAWPMLGQNPQHTSRSIASINMKSLLYYLRISIGILFGLTYFCYTASAINTITPVKVHDKNDPQYKFYLAMKNSLTVRKILSLENTTIHVSTAGNDLTGDGSQENPFYTIQKGVDEANNGDIVLVSDGRYVGEGNFNIEIIDKTITVTSENGSLNCIIDCENVSNSCAFIVSWSWWIPRTIIEGFTIKNGTGYKIVYPHTVEGGGVVCYQSSAGINNNVIINCTSNGILAQFSQIVMENNVIKNCDGYGIYAAVSYTHLRAHET